MKTLNKDNYEQEISSGINILYFTASWCGPCKALSPVLEKMSVDHSIFKIDVDENSELPANFAIRSIPTLLFFKDGIMLKKQIGSIPENKILEIINSL